jgi:hypothetical protein
LENLVIAVALVSLLGVAWSVWQIMSLKSRLASALSTSDTGNLEERLSTYFKHITDSDKRMIKLTAEYQALSASAALASQKISVVRFNPFGDTGGDQSFSLAVLDAHDSGYVFTSIHGREGTRVYVKPIDYGKSKYALSKEEQTAITQATKRVPKYEDTKYEEKKHGEA